LLLKEIPDNPVIYSGRNPVLFSVVKELGEHMTCNIKIYDFQKHIKDII